MINTKRLPLYSKLTNRKSIPHSLKLILSEEASLPFAYTIDRLCKPYQKAGIPIGDLEFMSMDLIPPFSEQYPFQIEPLEKFIPLDGKALNLKLKRSYEVGGFEQLSIDAHQELIRLEETKGYHCMMKHILESMIRLSNLAPLHQKKAEALNFNTTFTSCTSISKMMLWGHFLSIPASAEMDKAAATIQAAGIPLIWQDVPSIPLRVEEYR